MTAVLTFQCVRLQTGHLLLVVLLGLLAPHARGLHRVVRHPAHQPAGSAVAVEGVTGQVPAATQQSASIIILTLPLLYIHFLFPQHLMFKQTPTLAMHCKVWNLIQIIKIEELKMLLTLENYFPIQCIVAIQNIFFAKFSAL